jgi:tetratricopeptide (TPR) repeat protein
MAKKANADRIDRFLLGEMEAKEMASFKKELETDSELAAELKLQEDIFRALTEKDVIGFEQVLAEIQQEKNWKGRRVVSFFQISSFSKAIAIAAALIFLVVVGYFIFHPLFDPPLPQELFAEYFVVPEAEDILPPSGSNRSAMQDEESISQGLTEWDTAQSFFRKKEYRAALTLMEKVRPSSFQDSVEYFFQLGVLLLIDGRAEESLESFAQVKNGQPEALKWYQAMALLRVGKGEEARNYLYELARYQNPWQEKAIALLQKL